LIYCSPGRSSPLCREPHSTWTRKRRAPLCAKRYTRGPPSHGLGLFPPAVGQNSLCSAGDMLLWEGRFRHRLENGEISPRPAHRKGVLGLAPCPPSTQASPAIVGQVPHPWRASHGLLARGSRLDAAAAPLASMHVSMGTLASSRASETRPQHSFCRRLAARKKQQVHSATLSVYETSPRGHLAPHVESPRRTRIMCNRPSSLNAA
jgi:hypothetical protein